MNKFQIDSEEIHVEKPQDDLTNNLIIGIAVGVMITICAVIYVVASYLEAVMY